MDKQQLDIMTIRNRKIQEANSLPDAFDYETKLEKIQREYKEELEKIMTKH